MLLILFGPPGAGKSFIGNLLEDDYDFYFYDADIDLTPKLREAIQNKQSFTQAMRDEYYSVVLDKIDTLTSKHQNIIVAQAFAKEKNRQELLACFPQAKFIYIDADFARVNERLQKRNDWVTLDYAEKIRKIFEVPMIEHSVLDNNRDKTHLKKQLATLLQVTKL